MYSYEQIELGEYRGDTYFLKGFVDPKPVDREAYDPAVDADTYGAAVVRKGVNPLEDNIQIVRMDTKHDEPHLDKTYLPPVSDEDGKIWLGSDYSYKRMRAFLLANWTDYADLYIDLNE